MENDLHKTFGEIFNNDISAFRKQLLNIQEMQADRKESEKWVQNLRFLDISKVPGLRAERIRQDRWYARAEARDSLIEDQTAPSRIIPVTKRSDDDGNIKYIAVSWKWATPRYQRSLSPDEEIPTFRYRIKRPGQASHESSFPDLYMDRVIRFAQSRNIDKLWIDKECIYQRKGDERKWPKDVQHGVQIMDVVYGDSAASVGLLTTPLTHEYELDILSSLLHRSIFVDPLDEERPALLHGVKVKLVQRLILRILSDPRWSRGWIFQEDHVASSRMTLLIPCSKHIRSDKYDFGGIPGELQVHLATFRQAVTMFCLACPQYKGRWPNTEILDKAKQYNIWNKRKYNCSQEENPDLVRLWSDDPDKDGGARINTEHSYSNVQFYPTTTNSVLNDILNRSLEKDEDRIAILANALKFSKRLDTGKYSPLIKPGAYSLSTALLALILLNGEILMNTRREQCGDIPTPRSIMRHTLQSYLHSCQYYFNAPNFTLQQSFIDRCRFNSPIITERGIETKGFLFRLLPRQPPGALTNLLRLNNHERRALSKTEPFPRAWRTKLDAKAHRALGILIRKLNRVWPGGRLATYLQKHLVLDRYRSKKAVPSTPYVLDMMSALYQALRDDRELRMARIASAPGNSEPTAIFIKPPQDGWCTEGARRPYSDGETLSVKIFTSWDAGRKPYKKERLASLEVEMRDEDEETGQRRGNRNGKYTMFTAGWVNGVWCAKGEEMDTYVFPIPGITGREAVDENKKKRKRESGECSAKSKRRSRR